jgi:hypothetical protein
MGIDTMTPIDDLNAVEERAYRSTWDDGILDLLLGLGLVLLGVLFRTDLAGLAGVFVAALLLPVWAAAKKLITEPRLGYVKFSEQRRARERGWSRGLIALGAAMFVLAVGLYFSQMNSGGLREVLTELNAGYLLFGVLIGVGFAGAGSMIELPRLWAYAGIVVLATGVGSFSGVALEDALLAAGIAVSVWGAIVFRRFLARHPLPRDGAIR